MTTAWGNAEQSQGTLQDIRRVNYKTMTKAKVRLVGDLAPRYVYWLKNKEGKPIPIECLRFNRTTQQFDDSKPDPVAELPDEVYGGDKGERPQFAYVCNVIDRSDGLVKLLDLKKTIYDKIVSMVKDPDWGNPADPIKGYDITITKNPGKQAINTTYDVLGSPNKIPLTDEEKKLELYDLDKIVKRPTYDEVKEFLLKNTTYYLRNNGDFNPDEEVEDLT